MPSRASSWRYWAAIFCAAALSFGYTLSTNIALADAETRSNWSTGLAWGQSSSRWELDSGIRKMRPDTFRFTLTRHAIYSYQIAAPWELSVDLDTSIYHWDDPFRNRAITTFTLVPMLRIQTQWQHLTPFVGVGIGVAVLDSKDWMDRELGSHIMFEDKFELGFRYRYHQLTVGISHFSNADLARINHGANIYQLGYQYRW